MDTQAKKFAEALGRKDIAAAVGVKSTAVSNAVVRGWFPASWFIVVSDLANRKGLDCPPHLFGMKPLDNTQSVDSADDCQEKRNNTAGAA